MTSLHLNLPDDTFAHLQRQLAASYCASMDEYIDLLVQREANEQWLSNLEPGLLARYLEACEADLAKNGPSTKTIEDIIAEGTLRYHQRHGG